MVECPSRSKATGPTSPPKRGSSLVRRLVLAKDDPAKERVREWLAAIDGERLLNFGLTPDEISSLRPFRKTIQSKQEI